MDSQTQKTIGRAALIAVQGLALLSGLLLLMSVMKSWEIDERIITATIIIVGGIGVFFVKAHAYGIRFGGPRDSN